MDSGDIMGSEKQSWVLHDIVQGMSLVAVFGMMISGIIFVTDIKQDAAVQKAVQTEQERRITHVVTTQNTMGTKLESSIKDLRKEQGQKLDRLGEKIDRLIERKH